MKIMKRKYLIAIVTVPVILALDQWTKYLIRSRMSVGETIPLIRDFFSLHYLTNPGAAFGLFRHMDERYRGIFFLVVSLLAAGMVIYYLVKSEDEKIIFPVSLALVLGGAFGNVTDRIFIGHVTDFLLLEATFMGESAVNFLDKYIGGHYWPSFNVADSAIVVGIISMAIDLVFFTKENEHEEEDSGQQAAETK